MEIKIQLKTVNLSKSKLLQLPYNGSPRGSDEVLGWVFLNKTRYVLFQRDGYYYRGPYIVAVWSKVSNEFFGTPKPEREYDGVMKEVHKVSYKTWSGDVIEYFPKFDDQENLNTRKGLERYMENQNASEQLFY